MNGLFGRPSVELSPGAFHIPDWLDQAEQERLAGACRAYLARPAVAEPTLMPGGRTRMSVRTACLGWHWHPYSYSRTLDDRDGSPVPPFPDWLGDLGRRAHEAAYGSTDYHPDIALINYYDAEARMGQHQDKDERSDAPVVSFSLGDTGVFRFGNTEDRGRPYTDVELRSGDLVVFGGPSRFAYHGVPRVLPGTGPFRGRINVTLRVSGMD